jgi:hypothetical protein
MNANIVTSSQSSRNMPDFGTPGIMSDIMPDIMPVSDPDSVASRGDYRKREDTSFGDVRVNCEGIVSGGRGLASSLYTRCIQMISVHFCACHSQRL